MSAHTKLLSPVKSPLVTLLVPCCNESRHIEGSLRTILQQQEPPGGCEVVVADGSSEDGTRDILSRLSQQSVRLRVIDNPLRIVSSGLNAAIQVARGDVLIRMDAHTEYAPDYVLNCVETLDRTGADNVGGPWVARGGGHVSRAIAAAFQSPFAVGGARGHDPEHEGHVDTVYLGCWRRETFERFGYFDEELVRNQDDEHNLRIIRGGGKIWQSPKIKSWYRPRSSLSALFRQYLQYGYWKARVVQKHKLPASVRHLVPGGFVAALCALCVVGAIWQPAWWVLGALLLVYVCANLAASLHCAMKNELALFPVLPAVFAAYHFGYGIGFLRGVWDFLIRRKRPSATFTSLTRGEAHG